MSERPFMQLYVSDFLGDTLDLSTEGIGAYMLVLMAMWNAGGSLPDDEVKLARITRMSLRKWRAIAPEILGFFVRGEGKILHERLRKELQKSQSKSQSRASAGEAGGRAKALKDKKQAVANAMPMPQHLPDTIYSSPSESITRATKSDGKTLADRLIEAASSKGMCHAALALNITPVTEFLAQGYDLERDLLPVIREKAKPSVASWKYYITAALGRIADRKAIPPAPKPADVDWPARVRAWQTNETWAGAWGPKPGERGCRVPSHLLEEHAA